jgi:cell division protein FtsQ
MDGGGRELRALRGHQAPGEFAFVHRVHHSRFRILSTRFGSESRFRETFSSLIGRLPKGIGSTLTIGLFAATLLFGLDRGGHIHNFLEAHSDLQEEVLRFAGFDIRSVTITGLQTLNEQDVLAATGIEADDSLPFLDADAVRERLMALPLVRDVTVRKFFPNALSIGISENKPYALWQRDGEVSIIGSDGRVIGQMNDEAFTDLPLVVGEGANARATEFVAILDAAPDVKPLVKAGIRVGDRRWTLKLTSGLDVLLPEESPSEALQKFSTFLHDHKLADKDIVLVDLRYPDRVVLRLTEAAAAQREEQLKAKAKAKGGPA